MALAARNTTGAFVVPAPSGGVYLIEDGPKARVRGRDGKLQERPLGRGDLLVTSVDASPGGALSLLAQFSRADLGLGALVPHPGVNDSLIGKGRGVLVASVSAEGKTTFARALPGSVLGEVFDLDGATAWTGFSSSPILPGAEGLGGYVASVGGDGALRWVKPSAGRARWFKAEPRGLIRVGQESGGRLSVAAIGADGAPGATISILASIDSVIASGTEQRLLVASKTHSSSIVDLGSGPLPRQTGLAVASYRLPGGKLEWVRAFSFADKPRGEDPFSLSLLSLAADASGVLVVGTAHNNAQGSAPFPAGSPDDLFVTSLDSEGHQLWTLRRPLDPSCSGNTRAGRPLWRGGELFVALACPVLSQQGLPDIGKNLAWFLAWSLPR